MHDPAAEGFSERICAIDRCQVELLHALASSRSRLAPPADIRLNGMNSVRLARLAKAMGIVPQWREWRNRNRAADR